MARLFSRTLRRLGAACSVLAPLAGLLAGGGLAQAQTSYSSGYWYGNASPVSVLTHHNDGWRTGWNYAETTLTPSNVAATGGSKLFGLQGSVDLDGLVEVQPLVVPNAYVYGDPNAGRHDVVYVATANNTVYAIDPTTRKVLRSRNLGTPMSAFPGCEDNDKIIGVNSTPVIDPSTNSLYLIAHVRVGSGSEMHLHRLSLSSLKDIVAPVTIAAKAPLTNGSTATFDANYQRQRTALLLANGRVMAAFTSHCDIRADVARGWVMQWDAQTLDKARSYVDFSGRKSVFLTDTQATGPSNFFLATSWMSGAGPAVDEWGNVYFATGNTDPGALRSDGTGYVEDGVTNFGQSVVKLSPWDSRVLSYFTPANVMQLDNDDLDLGAGGVLLVPSYTDRLALQAGKDGVLRLMNRDSLGGHTPGGPDKVLAATQIGPCWCTPSYFNDGTPKVVSSGGTTLGVYAIRTKPYGLVKQAGVEINSGQFGGFFTSVSSNGAQNAIIWAVGRPQTIPGDLYLHAYSAKPVNGSLPLLYTTTAGTWNSQGNANTVPTVANGRVYVAGYKKLSIYGLGGQR
ncbi:MAG TPA: PQQ-binding-like beta-propeller repeat protein [Zoogloea sp.]|uniref:PQQ-binding-like beta-propeller repeat protein n=1 Tax=Zoogloea sp. TaxID=49181 RepID=UPI002BFBFDD5|nr:PQQ-binding-like beta-propeller repeat protein [Zoogloea sp.]HMZ77215.1 PQQ-binding-like beta-propeller repeat protein [Rhodocyclaceae bacterium]HNA68877.1 PQQ-binding-like beta-propeller repeat protein [Rhodocyclaceae bacterium]HNB65930.1 PQQ-binding-like beta-propeller repeat protein [Rhodocyclaceae bacterium]HNC80348.1 PQQ-binding-like beta-propeller repeat protein [Rhodocyclaceae bacterium]HND25351.1 PQQ-binding-like beta-propeller repeat protein [Rhodocyclaceae bacterium]